MANKLTYHPDDPDLRLARYLDRMHDDAPSVELADDPVAAKDPLFQLLEDYKSRAELKMRTEASPEVLENLMHHIEEGAGRRNEGDANVKDDTAGIRSYSVHKTSSLIQPAVLWRLAAVLMVVCFLALYWFLSDPVQPELLAESGDSKMEWVFVDGSRVVLRPHSVLYGITERDDEQRYKIQGEGYFDVAHRDDRMFIVETSEARVLVTGTRFTLRSWDDITEVFLEEGSIIFSRDDGSGAISIAPSQFSMIRDGHISRPKDAASDVYLGWMRDELVLDSRRMGDVAREIAHHFNITVSPEESLRDIVLSGTLLLDDPEQILDDLSVSLGADVEEVTPGHYRIFERDSM